MRRPRSCCSTPDGRFIREIGHKVYGFGYGHSIRYDRYDNLWLVDKGTDSVIKFDPSGKVVMNLGRRPEGFTPAISNMRSRRTPLRSIAGSDPPRM